MSNFIKNKIMRNQIIDNQENQGYAQESLSKTFMSNVFSYMFGALAISGITAYIFGNSESFKNMLYTDTGMSIFGWIVMLAPLGLVLLMSAKFQKFSYPTLLGVFALYSILTGMSLGFIFMVYSMGSIAITFLVTAGTFGVMAILGYTTSTDLTKFGSILRMAVIGLVIAMVVNMFMGSETMDYIISGIGVLIFTGLTAYDTQKLKNIGAQMDANSEAGKKASIMGALSLYLDFLNLFLFLLRFMGSRD
jgi:FtsH-binding integral membrane protein